MEGGPTPSERGGGLSRCWGTQTPLHLGHMADSPAPTEVMSVHV